MEKKLHYFSTSEDASKTLQRSPTSLLAFDTKVQSESGVKRASDEKKNF